MDFCSGNAAGGGTKAAWTLPRLRREIQVLLCTWAGVCCYCGAAQPRTLTKLNEVVLGKGGVQSGTGSYFTHSGVSQSQFPGGRPLCKSKSREKTTGVSSDFRCIPAKQIG